VWGGAQQAFQIEVVGRSSTIVALLPKDVLENFGGIERSRRGGTVIGRTAAAVVVVANSVVVVVVVVVVGVAVVQVQDEAGPLYRFGCGNGRGDGRGDGDIRLRRSVRVHNIIIC
jgi:hypothetical protein